MTVGVPVMCRVDGCGLRAVASVVREDLPGPIQLCATHTEDFRMNGAALGGYLECWRFRSDLCSSSSCCAGWPKLVAYRERAGVKGLRLGQIPN